MAGLTEEQQDAQDHLEAEAWDDDSAYGKSTSSSFLTSIASEVTRGLFENGRRYHSFGDAEYAFPNDERESIGHLPPNVVRADEFSRSSGYAARHDDLFAT